MPKRVKNSRRPARDANVAAFKVVSRFNGENQSEPTPVDISRVMSALGRRGGKIGGKRRLETMTPEQRSEAALRAARARWGKRKKT